MTDLQATVSTARSNLRTIWSAHAEAIRINLDYGPGAWKADGMPHHRNPPAEGSILHYRGQDVTKTDLSAAYDASVRQLAEALVPASEISWIDDGVSQGSVLPRNQSHIPLSTAQSIGRLVNYSLITTQEVLAEAADSLTLEVREADAMYIEQVCEQVLASLLCLPDDLVTERPRSTKVDHPSHKRCANCKRWVPWGVNRCTPCQEHIVGQLHADRDQRQHAPVLARCVDCAQAVQDRGQRCWACRKRRERKAS